MKLTRLNELMLSALFISTADASPLTVREKVSQRMLANQIQKNNNDDVANPSARQLLDQLRKNKKSMNSEPSAAQFFHDGKTERRTQVLTEPRSLRANNNNIINQNNQRILLDSFQRKLPFTGHLWDACLPDSTPTSEEITAATFNGTTYDDALNPACNCWYDEQTNQVWMECTMGDLECSDPTNSTCEETHEIFTFADATGDLSAKNTCNFCKGFSYENCTGIEEICSVVYFDDNETPEECFFQELFQDGTLERCNNCQICQENGEVGMNYDCFGRTTNGACDTTQSFHVHNFAPVISSGPNAVGGRFGDICRQNEEFAIYEKTSYDDPYNKVCDCDNPNAGVIVCDLFLNLDFCVANECSPLSEIFYFGQNDLTSKVTCDSNNGLCTEVFFDENDGTPTSCKATLFPGPLQCTSCNICQDEETNAYGIQFSCFGADQEKCLTSNGRAINNFKDQPTAPPTAAVLDPPPTQPPTSTDEEPSTPVSKAVSEEPSVPTGAIVGAFVGGLVLAGLFALLWSRKNKTDIEQETNPMGGDHDPPVDEAHQDDMDEAGPPKEVPTLT